MDINQKLIVGYGGTLDFYSPTKNTWFTNILVKGIKFFIDYNHDLIDKSTRSAHYLIEGLQLLLERNHNYKNKIELHLWGNINPKYKNQVSQLQLEEVVIIGDYLSKEETQNKLQKCDVLFLPIEVGKGDQETLFIPGKLFEYLSLKKPILALTKECDCKRIIEKSGLGIIANPDQPLEIAKKLEYCIKNQENLQKLYVPNQKEIEKYQFQNLTKSLAAQFDAVLKSTK